MFRENPDSPFLPDGDKHFSSAKKGSGRPAHANYQADRLKAAYRHVKSWDCAIDIGAHVGLVSMQLANRFARVLAYEACPPTFECLMANTSTAAVVLPFHVALGSENGVTGIEMPLANSGDVQLVPGNGKVPLSRLDDRPELVGLPSVGLIKIDVQGYEPAVLLGAAETLRRFRPVVIVECEPPGKLRREFFKAGAAVKFLESLGASEVALVGADRIFTFPGGHS